MPFSVKGKMDYEPMWYFICAKAVYEPMSHFIWVKTIYKPFFKYIICLFAFFVVSTVWTILFELKMSMDQWLSLF